MGSPDPLDRWLNDRQKVRSMTQAAPPTSRMVQLMEKLAPVEGYNLSALEDIRFLRSNRPLTRTPVLYYPGIGILCQGRKRGSLGNDVSVYENGRGSGGERGWQ